MATEIIRTEETVSWVTNIYEYISLNSPIAAQKTVNKIYDETFET